MANGFQQRWLGKVMAKQFWLAGSQFTGSSADYNTSRYAAVVAAASTVTALLASTVGITTINGTSLTYTLPAPVVGQRKVYDAAAAASTTLLRRLYTGAGVLFDSTNTVLSLSTVAGGVELIGVTTAKWSILHYNGGTLGTAT